ncbi:MAG: hypothetical protein LC664_11485, partial [Flavobacteriales bacterium]|nr:hypothetical protein [Flavobacteriales bacterium]
MNWIKTSVDFRWVVINSPVGVIHYSPEGVLVKLLSKKRTKKRLLKIRAALKKGIAKFIQPASSP